MICLKKCALIANVILHGAKSGLDVGVRCDSARNDARTRQKPPPESSENLETSGKPFNFHHVAVKRFCGHVRKHRIESQVICFQTAQLKNRFLYPSVRYVVKQRKIEIRYHRAAIGY